MEQAIWILVWVCVLLVVGIVAQQIIVRFFPAEVHMPALLIVGIILLILLLAYVVGWPPSKSRLIP